MLEIRLMFGEKLSGGIDFFVVRVMIWSVKFEV